MKILAKWEACTEASPQNPRAGGGSQSQGSQLCKEMCWQGT